MMVLRRDALPVIAMPQPGVSYENLGLSKVGSAAGGAAAADNNVGSLFAVANSDGPIELYIGDGVAAARTKTYLGSVQECAADYADGASEAPACCGYDDTTITDASKICQVTAPTCQGYEGDTSYGVCMGGVQKGTLDVVFCKINNDDDQSVLELVAVGEGAIPTIYQRNQRTLGAGSDTFSNTPLATIKVGLTDSSKINPRPTSVKIVCNDFDGDGATTTRCEMEMKHHETDVGHLRSV